MAKEYGQSKRLDPQSVIEAHVSPPVRQIQPQRVIETVENFTPAACIAYNTGATFESLTDAGGENAINWNIEVSDNAALHDNATNNERITIVSAGSYRCMVRVIFNSNGNADGTRIVKIYTVSGGTPTLRKTETVTNAGAGTDTFVAAVWEQFMGVGDYFEARAEITGTGTVTLQGGTADDSYITVTRVS